MKEAKPVSRSTFQKKAEECKRLKRDIYLMAIKTDMPTFKKWRKYFNEEDRFQQMLREIILEQAKSVHAKS